MSVICSTLVLNLLLSEFLTIPHKETKENLVEVSLYNQNLKELLILF